MKRWLFPLLLMTTFCLLHPVTLSAQVYPFQAITTKNLDSDNFVEITWDYSEADDCPIDEIVFKDRCENTTVFVVLELINESSTGTRNLAFGPNHNFIIQGQQVYNCINSGGDYEECSSIGETIVTQPIFPPKNVLASEGYSPYSIEITWNKGTDLAETDVEYYIYRDGVHIATVEGNEYRFVDGNSLSPGADYEYSVSTVYKHDTSEESPLISDFGSTVFFNASDGDYYGRTALTFANSSKFADYVKVERWDGTGALEEIALLDVNATSYNDYTGIPGLKYTYYLTYFMPDGSNYILTESGYSKPNGVIRGTVKTLQGVGIPNVEIEVTPAAGNIGGGPGTNCSGSSYCATTDGAGYFEIDEIYYHASGEFVISPISDGSQQYEPASITRKLTMDNRTASDVDFIDLSAHTLSGTITYQDSGCGVSNVTMMVNGQDEGVRSAADGTWSYVVVGSGQYRFEPRYEDLEFQDGETESVISIFVDEDANDLDFTVLTNRQIEILVQSGCATPLGTSVEVSLTNTDGCFTTRNLTVGSDGRLVLTDLPPRDGYKLLVTKIEAPVLSEQSILDQFSAGISFDVKAPGTYEKLNVENTGTGTTVDTITEDFPTLKFIYRGVITTEIDFVAAGAELADCSAGTPYFDLPIVQKNVKYPLEIKVFEELGDQDCPVLEGVLLVQDEVSDRENSVEEIPIVNGIARYDMVAGEPNATTGNSGKDYQKYFAVEPTADFANGAPTTHWLILEGFVNVAPNFVTTTPEIPQLILHDPPGDNSYAFVEKGTTISTFIKNSILSGTSEGSFTDLSVGGQIDLGPSSAKAGSSVEMSLTQGTNESEEEGLISTITFTENFATSSLENFTGEGGDVYIGAALNQTYDIATEVSFNNCAVEIDSSLIFGLYDFATTFIYTESHIKNALLPQLQTLMSLSDTTTEAGRRQYNDYLADYNSWVVILEANASNRDNATEQFLSDENVSISAGATLSKSYTVLEGIETSYQYDVYLEDEMTESVDVSVSTIGLYLDTQNGSMITSSYEFSEFQSESEEVLRTIGYVIEDNDIGDAVTFNVYQDPDYDTPIFRLLSGSTSCPYEPNTAARDLPALSISPTVVNNIPFDGSGLYSCRIQNNSQTGESREYHVRVIGTSNPDGAIVRLAGNIINNSPVSVFVGPNNYADLVLTVERGPVADTYQDIQVMVYPPCEYELWQDGGNLVHADTISISANFESQCSQVSLVSPGNNWIVNQASNNVLPITIGGFDPNNAAFESVSAWIKKGNEGFTLLQEVPKASLTFPYHDLDLDLSAYSDGNYTVKVSANCNGGSLISYSNEISGVIDRSSLAPFGYPSPADGFLEQGEQIMVVFDQEISENLAGVEYSLKRLDTGIDLVVNGKVNGNVFLFELDENIDLFSAAYEGVELAARVHYLKSAESGNVQKYAVDWTFTVNAKPVFWDPEIINLVAPANSDFSFTANLKNLSHIPKTFSLDENFDPAVIKVPEWLSPAVTEGVILPYGEAKIDFAFDTSLPPGIYQGEVVALVDNKPMSLNITIEYLAERINWSVNTAAYENSMNLVMQFEVLPGSNKLSTDTRDLIAAFVNGEIRGVAPIEYVESAQVYRAFMTVYGAGGNQSEAIEFRFWTALDGREYGAIESVSFSEDAVTGSVAAPFILHPAGNFQVIPLRQGWNFVSLNVNPVSTDRSEVLKSIMNTSNRLVLKSLKSSSEYTATTGWQGNLKNVDPAMGYMLYLSDHADTLRIVGNALPLPYDLDVAGGWNWIGYAGQDPATTETTLQDLTPADGDLIKSQTEFATYQAVSGWTGSLATMNPGKGYKLQLGSSGTLTYRGGWELDPHAWEHNMVVTATIEDAVLPKRLGEEWILGAFVDGVCRGFTDFSDIDVLNEQRAFLLVYGQPEDAGKIIRYRLRNTRTGEELNIREATGFVPNGLIGAVLDPQPLHVEYFVEQVHFQLIPNPVRHSAQLLLDTNLDDIFTVELRSMDGRLLRTLVQQRFEAGKHRLPIDLGTLPGGVYLLQLTGNGIRQIQKIVKQ
ncbi:T9SS type A sorting domain-containing protein [Flavilitoribacter nigricans]|uniref:Fibronectin type-III domain-containing protein n=1 Tax=Flavilitoribacter nigricans (strain ATCC 23147 / DSM 23189 / NBRC 102662 / NCIMB 1420 / SS-2) TaxID=1122177 RepID=A0A2D0N5W3_FLAN2|nr:T9SS type A sorting domain-containing protein [Flavilitoribacter nigricans]PHN03788.1 hypothetical protein CRP01_24890 [Flavilitoribacter nigricans DSM 23189 = NBRC 102662]